MKSNQITSNFSWKEFSCKCGCGLNSVDVGLVNRLQVIRDILEEVIFINSGCRCEKHNKDEGGVSSSYHLKKNGCKAIDWTIKDKEKLARFDKVLNEKWSGGWHYYPGEQFIHCDVGPRRRW